MENGKYKVDEIISYIVKRDESLYICQEMIDSDITNLKLQKLLYYVQGHYIATFNQKMFCSQIVNWSYGPIIEKVYYDFQEFESNTIVPKVLDNDNYCCDNLSSQDKKFLDKVIDYYNQFSPWKLRNMTHDENNLDNPWIKTEKGEEITFELMKKYFSLDEFSNRI
jgi:uncharacterized phage-associated protein